MIVRFTHDGTRIYCNGKLIAYALSTHRARVLTETLNSAIVTEKRHKALFDKPDYCGKYHGRTIPYDPTPS